MSGNDLIEALQNADVYPYEVTRLSVIETHISWVVLTGSYAYKIKKPVDFGFLDFSTLTKRKFYCEEELRLNSRFSDDLYLDVVPITGMASAPHIGGEGEAIEYAVRMVEFPSESLFEQQIRLGKITQSQIEALAVKLGDFHNDTASPLSMGETSSGSGSPDAVQATALENFKQILPLLTESVVKQQLNSLHTWTKQQFGELQDVFGQRREQGFIRECHGDLHLGNIALIHGEVTFFDCIEFSENLRWIDTMSELAFLIMDLEAKGHPKWANRVLNTYLECTGDYAGLQVLHFYKVYRALVRAKVSLLQANQAAGAGKEKDKAACLLSCYQHIALAHYYMKEKSPFLAITHGVSGTGKSTVSGSIAANSGAIRLRSDVERKRLYGLKSSERRQVLPLQDIYSEDATDRTFAHLAHIARLLLGWQYPVIIDATFLSKRRRQDFRKLREKSQIPFVVLDCLAAPDTILLRLKTRAEKSDDASDADVAVMQSQLKHLEPISEKEKPYTIAINTDEKDHINKACFEVEQHL